MNEFAAASVDVAAPRDAAQEMGFWLDRFVAEWQHDRTLTAMEFCRRHPTLAADDRMIAVIGYEEFCRRAECGEELDAAFLRQFPDGGAGLTALIGVHKYMGGHGSFLPGLLELPAELLDNLQEASQVDWPEPGETVAGYHLLELLGEGGFARVYLAEELALGRRRVALKVSTNATAEAHTLGKLRHPNVAPVHSVAYDARRRLNFICMPFLGRATLNDLLARLFRDGRRPHAGQQLLDALAEMEAGGETPDLTDAPADARLARGSYVDAVAHLGAQLAAALAFTHRQNVCHRDLKPSNVLVDRAGKPMLLDFHLSSPADEAARQCGGTLHYMPPEAVKQVLDGGGRAAAADPRSDIYSLAVVLYESLCGERPFMVAAPQGATLVALGELYECQRQPPFPLGQRNPDVEPALARLIADCLSFDIAARPATAEQLAGALARLAGGRGRFRRRAWRHRRGLRAAAAAACLGLAATGYLLAARPPYAERQFQAARRAVAVGDFPLALAHLDSAEAAGHQVESVAKLREDVQYRQAKQAFAVGDYRAAREYCTRLIELDPASWRAYVLRARTHLRLGDLKAAWADTELANTMDSDPEIVAVHGDCFCARKQWNSAIRAYHVAVTRGFVSAGLFNNMAHALAKSNRREESLACLNRALEIEPLPSAYYQRAAISFALALDAHRLPSEQAVVDLETAIRLSPDDYRTRLLAATVYATAAEQGGDRDRLAARDQLLESLRLGLRADEIPTSGPLAAIAAAAAGSADYQSALARGASAPRTLPPRLVDSLEKLP